MKKYFLCLLKFPIFHYIPIVFDGTGWDRHKRTLYYKITKKITNAELHISCYRLSDDLKDKITCPVVFLEQALLSGCIYIFTYVYWWPVILEQDIWDIHTLLAWQEGRGQGLGSVCRVTFLTCPTLCNGTQFLQTLFIASPCSLYLLPHLCL